MPGSRPFQTPHQAADGPGGAPVTFLRGSARWAGELREGLTQEAAWELA